MATSLRIPPSAQAVSNDPAGADSGSIIGDLQLPERYLPYGGVVGVSVRKVARFTMIIAAGAPGTTTKDLAAALDLEGNALTAGTIVYMAARRVRGSDHCWRKSAANAVELISGTTDTMKGYGYQVLIDAAQNGVLATDAGEVLSASKKNITIESTLGATVEVIVGVV